MFERETRREKILEARNKVQGVRKDMIQGVPKNIKQGVPKNIKQGVPKNMILGFRKNIHQHGKGCPNKHKTWCIKNMAQSVAISRQTSLKKSNNKLVI